jgi:hypothetical protein
MMFGTTVDCEGGGLPSNDLFGDKVLFLQI